MTIAIAVVVMILAFVLFWVAILDVETGDGETMWIVDYWLKRIKQLRRTHWSQ